MKLWQWTRSHRSPLAIVAIGVWCLVIVASQISSQRPFLDEMPPPSFTISEIHQVEVLKGPVAALSLATHHSEFEVKCPQTLKENETTEFRLTYKRYIKVVDRLPYNTFDPLPGSSSSDYVESRFYIDPFPEEAEAELHSSGFKISPSTRIKKPPFCDLPAVFAWTIKPESEGKHVVLLDISRLLRKPTKDTLSLETHLRVNDQEKRLDDEGILRFTILVLTIWGVQRIVFEIIRSVVVLVGFVLLYPLLHDLVRRLLGWST